MKSLLRNYIDTFRGLSIEVWWLALITLINRAGTMVIPFLSLYLTQGLHLSLKEVGWIMTAYGFGSVVGSWLGGKLTDMFGYYKVMLASMLLTGISFVALQYLSTFVSFSIGLFIVMIVADCFRPAMFVAVSSYSKDVNKTRSVTLIRLAINLGFSAGPVVGGLIITYLSYSGLFWVDGVTCFLAGLLILLVLNPKKVIEQKEVIDVKNPISPYKDKLFWIFFGAMFLFAIVFLQYFSTVPLYYKEVIMLNETEIGLLMGMNGALIFILEMPLVKWVEKKKFNIGYLMLIGAILTGLSIIVLNASFSISIIILGMLFMTIGEMVAFPFSNTFAMERAKRGNQGAYMAMYSISFSVAHIFGHNLGMQMINDYGYQTTWSLMTVLAVLCAFLLFVLTLKMKKEPEFNSKLISN
ncbi:MAG: MDR family MFS transporter [Flavobacteriales bacterium]